MKKYFITATGTEIGKTLVTTSLCWQLRQQQQKIVALKPIISGYEEGDENSDSGLIVQSCGIKADADSIAAISPWRYKAPLAPNMAAALEGNPVDFAKLVSHCKAYEAGDYDLLLSEGVGGVMAPITDEHTVLDWMEALAWPVILVAGSYLGTISHILSAAEVIKSRGLRLHAVVICESENSSVDVRATVSTLEKFLPQAIAVKVIARLPKQYMLWKVAPSLTGLVE